MLLQSGQDVTNYESYDGAPAGEEEKRLRTFSESLVTAVCLGVLVCGGVVAIVVGGYASTDVPAQVTDARSAETAPMTVPAAEAAAERDFGEVTAETIAAEATMAKYHVRLAGASASTAEQSNCASNTVQSGVVADWNGVTRAPGGWGGTCTCPDGQVYRVGDVGWNGHAATAEGCPLACAGGVSGTCSRTNPGGGGKSVTCGACDAAPAPAPAPTTTESAPPTEAPTAPSTTEATVVDDPATIYYDEANNVHIRHSLLEMPAADQERYLLSVQKLQEGGFNSTMGYLTGIHGYPSYECIHGLISFTGWHRVYLGLFELHVVDAHEELYGNRNIAIPFHTFIDRGYPRSSSPYHASLKSLVDAMESLETFRSIAPPPPPDFAQDMPGRIAHLASGVTDAFVQGVQQPPFPRLWHWQHWYGPAHVHPFVDNLNTGNFASFPEMLEDLEGGIHNVGHWIFGEKMVKEPVSAFTQTFWPFHNAIEMVYTKLLDSVGHDLARAEMDAHHPGFAASVLSPFKHADGTDYTVADTFGVSDVDCLDYEGFTRVSCSRYKMAPGSRLLDSYADRRAMHTSRRRMTEAGQAQALELPDQIEVIFEAPKEDCSFHKAERSFVLFAFFAKQGTNFTDADAQQMADEFMSEDNHPTHDDVSVEMFFHFGGQYGDTNPIHIGEIIPTSRLPQPMGPMDLYAYAVDADVLSPGEAFDIADPFVPNNGYYEDSGCDEGKLPMIDASWLTVIFDA